MRPRFLFIYLSSKSFHPAVRTIQFRINTADQKRQKEQPRVFRESWQVVLSFNKLPRARRATGTSILGHRWRTRVRSFGDAAPERLKEHTLSWDVVVATAPPCCPLSQADHLLVFLFSQIARSITSLITTFQGDNEGGNPVH